MQLEHGLAVDKNSCSLCGYAAKEHISRDVSKEMESISVLYEDEALPCLYENSLFSSDQFPLQQGMFKRVMHLGGIDVSFVYLSSVQSTCTPCCIATSRKGWDNYEKSTSSLRTRMISRRGECHEWARNHDIFIGP
ncbi:hypothetical protein AgCh_022103 [Apium graveolens]